MISEHTLKRSLVDEMIIAGWQPDWIIQEPNLSDEDGSYRPDFVLLIGTYPIATLEVQRRQPAKAILDPQLLAADITPPRGDLFPCRLGSDGIVVWNSSDPLQRWNSFPTPQELWKFAGYTWNEEDDPRLIAGRSGLLTSNPMSLHQCLAMGKILDAQIQGERHVYAVMPIGAGGSAVALESMLRLLHVRKVNRPLILSNTSVLAEEIHHRLHLQKHFAINRIEKSLSHNDASEIHISTVGYFAAQRVGHPENVDSRRYDLIVLPDLRSNTSMRRILNHFEHARSIGILSAPNVAPEAWFGRAVYARRQKDILDEINLRPPHGMRMAGLGEIATISIGVVPSRGPMEIPMTPDDVRAVLVVHARDIPQEPVGSVEPGPPELVHTAVLNEGELVPGDIVMSRISNSVQLRVGAVEFHGSYASTQVIRIRITQKDVDPADVLQHLRSHEALFYLRVVSSRLQSSLRITPMDLAGMPILSARQPRY